MFVALSHWDKHKFLFVAAANKIIICYQTVAKKQKNKNIIRCLKKSSQNAKKGIKINKKWQQEPKNAKKFSIVDTFGNFLAKYTNFVYCSDSVGQKIIFVCCSYSVRQTKF